MKIGAYYVSVKDDFCLRESVLSLQDQGVGRIVVVSPTTYWSSDRAQTDSDLESVRTAVEGTCAELVSTSLESTGYQHTDDVVRAPLSKEAAFRNYALRQLADCDYVITVDADEYWVDGTVAHVTALIKENTDRPVKINLPMVPVIGVPGLPVRRAKDVALVATTGCVFEWGRSAKSSGETEAAVVTGNVRVIHFSATRRNLQDLVVKSRESAHYVDPTYAFDAWLSDVVPNVREGMTDVHMYKSQDNIWPEVGSWSAKELSSIPESLHAYLKK